MVASGTTQRIISAFKLTFDGEGLDDVDCAEFTPPEFAGTVVSLQRCTNGITEAIAMQGGFTPIQEMTVKVVVNADGNSSYMLLHKWLEKCKPKSRGGGGEMPKLSGSFTSFNWKGDVVEEYTFAEAWPKKFDLDDMNASDEDDLVYATFTILVEKYERTKV
jgi:hypothetical protein